MHDRDFEKQVQQKMQELRFAPGADVWTRVQADIRRKKRRRPVILWLLFAGLLVGSSWLLYTGISNDSPVAQASGKHTASGEIVKENGSAENATAGTNDKAQSTKEIPERHIDPGTENDNTGSTGVAVNKDNNSSDKSINNIPRVSNGKNVSGKQSPPFNKPTHKTLAQVDKPQIADKRDDDVQPGRSKNNSLKDDKIINNKIKEDKVKDEPVVSTNTPDPALQEKKSTVDDPVTSTPVTEKTENTQSQPQETVNNTKDTAIAMKNNAVKNPAGKRGDWQWGVNAGLGVSDLGNQLFQGTTVADFAYGGGTVSPAAPPIRRPSSVEAGVAFQVGGYASKGIGRKFRLKLGLNYEYYSNRITVGSYVGSTRLVNQGAAMNVVQEYYTAGNTNKYTNSYHFISLPLSLQWKINKHPKRGLIWENGISPTRLVYTDALHYDGISGSYYKDDNVFKQTQWVVSSSLLFSLKTNGKLQLYAGPHVQYGFSNIVGNDAQNNKHLRYAGLKMMAGFNKK